MARLTFLTTPAILIALCSLTACASGPKRGGGPQGGGGGGQSSGVFAHPVGLYFVGHDTDNNRVTTLTELDAGIKMDWAKFGRNPSATQFQSWSLNALGSGSAMPTFLSFDTNMNGVITESEFETRLIGEFNRLDKNGDGKLMRSELIFNVQQRNTEDRSQSKPSGGKKGQGGGRPPR
ncbi:hypothetical protein GCM10009069_20820 [Algimonas arctica]|uniref:EF-hand domain-containing protein n=1 Tax=Algimonas arctica TaxID=1479486 RepID=A0A8J3G2W6_9PROT|nr:hypothetical protein [Algimonas arctica]GHA97721.1 hypothetical protein GCM10009069_20820 [Algimonas arctica]